MSPQVLASIPATMNLQLASGKAEKIYRAICAEGCGWWDRCPPNPSVGRARTTCGLRPSIRAKVGPTGCGARLQANLSSSINLMILLVTSHVPGARYVNYIPPNNIATTLHWICGMQFLILDLWPTNNLLSPLYSPPSPPLCHLAVTQLECFREGMLVDLTHCSPIVDLPIVPAIDLAVFLLHGSTHIWGRCSYFVPNLLPLWAL